MIEVITAPENVDFKENEVCNKVFCFLAGGISQCYNWQQEVIEELRKIDSMTDLHLPNLVIINPRRESFDMNDDTAAEQQICWEYKALTNDLLDIFSIYFCKSDSDQPICMYELGRYATKKMYDSARFNSDPGERIVISVEDGYKRSYDVDQQIQCINDDFCCGEYITVNNMNVTPHSHAVDIYKKYATIALHRLEEVIERL